MSSIIGLLFCLIAFLLILVIIFKTLVYGDTTSGWPSLVCIIFLVSGVQLFSLGIIGQYLSKTYLEVKHRPIYIIKETEEEYIATPIQISHKIDGVEQIANVKDIATVYGVIFDKALKYKEIQIKTDDKNKSDEINKNILDLANLINNPAPERREEDIE